MPRQLLCVVINSLGAGAAKAAVMAKPALKTAVALKTAAALKKAAERKKYFKSGDHDKILLTGLHYINSMLLTGCY